ncbi:EAL domain, c-di-GMP-specific phosphodiesterase class I (or its enzymatically inactive variant) [Parafrankia irregularis]|uniref:EAL domain, c-di-GMP-specific phosphodiesterase class I (Or its enzymatically inactive variant) n=1 Tax=Parafrankia irregularis TaxID=795642 RepID=A0A0S4QP34_9ACTN|nr:EAL domain-containing protein [Parafrankia irregularis]MBE3201652.1 EAL domain-containing protein [Parafrankia sp. CH37]CUU57393.1 EAL domain, c-di-GMP-specific phosphodiesterase class I (or its enzymatically inactive variant) [Parafrankia irregularis]
MAEYGDRGGTGAPPCSVRPELDSKPEPDPERWPGLEPVTELEPVPAAVAGLLATARGCLEVDVCWLSRLIGGTQVIEACSGDAASFGVRPGSTVRYGDRRHSRGHTGHRPAPAGQTGPSTGTGTTVAEGQVSGRLGAGSYLGVPVVLADGRPYGMLCCLSHDRALTARGRQARSLILLAGVLAESLSCQRPDLEARRGRFRQLIDNGGPRMTFQPVFELPSMDCMGAEALARFPPDFGGPERCFAEAAELGLDLALEVSAIRVALRALPRLAPEFGLGINASPTTVVSGEIAKVIADVPAERLVLEITEHDRIDDYPAMDRALDVLRREGVRVAVDDVGRGSAGLRHLVHLRPDFIKMDRCLTQHIDVDPARRALATALVSFARETDGLVLAEGVETAAELDVLIGAGVHQAQGHYLAPPGPLPLPPNADQTPPVAKASPSGPVRGS